MAAIAGVVRFGETPVPELTAHIMMGAMAHRAPDGTAYFDDETCSLGHGALHATPESVFERQPIVIGDRWVLAVDGRIDNRDALGRALGIRTATDAELGDADLFARSWKRWGEEFWRHIEGDFALAVWDRSARRLTLMRDRVGVRPLFFARTSQVLLFASEPEALLGLGGVSRVCDGDALAYLLGAFDFDDQERTFYRDVRRIRPAWRLEAAADGAVRSSSYWQPQPKAASLARDPEEWVQAFNAAFDAALRCRLRSLAPPTLLLSGGIDSGTVLAAARRLQPPSVPLSLRLLSFVESRPPLSSETRNILRLHAGGDHGLRVPVEEVQRLPVFSRLLEETWDSPHPIDNSLSYARLGCLLVRQGGGRVVLDGVDGDTQMASAHSRAGALAASGHFLQALREARLASRVNTYLQGVRPAQILLHGLYVALEPQWLSVWRYRRQSIRGGDGCWIDARFAKQLDLRGRRLKAAVRARRDRAELPVHSLRSQGFWNPGVVRALEGTDRTYGRFGIEGRHPWCDQRVVDLLLDIPEALLARDGWTKWLARKAAAPVLGEEIAWYSGKSHLGSRLTPLLIAAAQEKVDARLAQAQDVLVGVVNGAELARLRRDWNADPASAMNRDADAIMQLATLAGWMERNRLEIA